MDGADGVYPASEDTYLLIDALTEDEDFLKEKFSHGMCIEVGCVVDIDVRIRTIVKASQVHRHMCVIFPA